MASRRAFLRSLAAAFSAARAVWGTTTGTAILQNVTLDGASLLWISDGPAQEVIWRAGASAGLVEAEVRASTAFGPLSHARLTNLPSGARVEYSIGKIATGHFFTPVARSALTRAVVFGDSGSGAEEQFRLASLMAAEPASLVLHAGDLCYPLSTDELLEERWYRPYASLFRTRPVYPCLGNHDYSDSGPAPYLRRHALPAPPGVPPGDAGLYYSFHWNGIHFLVLNSNDPLEHPPDENRMLRWLDGELAGSRAFWRVALFHHPPYTGGRHAGDPRCRLARERLAPRLEAAHVPLVLNGHEHNYQRLRSSETTYCTTGGGGASLYAVGPHPLLENGGMWHHYLRLEFDSTRLRAEVIGLSGDILDQFEVAPAPSWTGQRVTNAADFTPALAPGGLATLFGYHIGADPAVSLDGQPLPILFESGGQVNFRLPHRTPGPARLRVRASNGSLETHVDLAPAAPALFLSPGGPVIVREDGLLRLYATGCAGASVTVFWDNRRLEAGPPRLVPSLPGVDEIVVPDPGPAAGPVQIRLVVLGRSSQPALLPAPAK